jgi:tetratricopeptide (TPR) repeat protein
VRARRARWIARSLCPFAVAALVWTGHAAGGGDGLAAFKAGRYEEAAEAFRRDGQAANAGAALERLGRYEEAVAEFGRALEAGPSPREEAGIRYGMGTALLGLGRVEEAVDELRASLRLDPGDLQAKINLEIALRRLPPPPPEPSPSPAPPRDEEAPAGGAGGAPPPSAPPGAPQPLTREQAEQLLDALGRRERIEFPRSRRRPTPSDPDAPDW